MHVAFPHPAQAPLAGAVQSTEIFTLIKQAAAIIGRPPHPFVSSYTTTSRSEVISASSLDLSLAIAICFISADP